MNALLTEYDEERVLADIGQERYAEGKIEGKIEEILAGLSDLGNVPDELRVMIQSQQDETTLRRWLRMLGSVETVEEFQKRIEK